MFLLIDNEYLGEKYSSSYLTRGQGLMNLSTNGQWIDMIEDDIGMASLINKTLASVFYDDIENAFLSETVSLPWFSPLTNVTSFQYEHNWIF